MTAAVDAAQAAYAAKQGLLQRVADMRREADTLERQARALDSDQRVDEAAELHAAALRLVDGEEDVT